MSSRTFSPPLHDLKTLEEAVATFTARAAEKVRSQKSRAGGIHVFLKTNPYDKTRAYRSHEKSTFFLTPQNHTGSLINHALKLLRNLYKSGYRKDMCYRRAGVILLNLRPQGFHQPNLFESYSYQRPDQQMRVLDALNKRFGRDKVSFAAQGFKKPLRASIKNRSPRYTTLWEELPVVHGLR